MGMQKIDLRVWTREELSMLIIHAVLEMNSRIGAGLYGGKEAKKEET